MTMTFVAYCMRPWSFVEKSLAVFQETSCASHRQCRYRLYEQVQEAAEAGTVVNRLCRAAGISRAGYYRFRQRGKSKGTDMDLRSQMQRIALRWPAYGYSSGVHAELLRPGWTVNHQRVSRVLREDNLLCVRRRKFVLGTTDSRHGLPIYPNLAADMVLTTSISSGLPISPTA
jgi:hypothetical protein